MAGAVITVRIVAEGFDWSENPLAASELQSRSAKYEIAVACTQN